jgi:hypothetical protein
VVLNDDAMVEVLGAAKAAGALGLFASSSRQVCSLARSRIAVRLAVYDKEDAALLLRSSSHSVPPFSACTQLHAGALNC